MKHSGNQPYLNRKKYTLLWALTVALFYGICVTLYILGHDSFLYPALGGLVLHQVSRKAFAVRGFRTKMLVTGVLLLMPCLFLVAEYLAKKEYGLKQVSEFGIAVGLSLFILSLLELTKPLLQQKLERIKFFSVDAKWKRILLILGGIGV